MSSSLKRSPAEYEIDGFQLYEYSSQNSKTVIFFAHANGIPAITYASLWGRIASELNVCVITYDMRGIGKTTNPPVYNAKHWVWEQLVTDHIHLFESVKKTFPKDTQFILSGHSAGAWISLLSTKILGVYPLILCDPPILYPKIAFLWFLLALFKQKDRNPKSMKVLNRKKGFSSFEAAFASLKRAPLLAKWSDETLKNYIEGSFHTHAETKHLHLKHSPQWEAYLFAQYPATTVQGFLQIPKKTRQKLKPLFLIGGSSDACNPKAKGWVKFFFPHLAWKIIPNAGHMFPLENADEVISAFKEALKIT